MKINSLIRALAATATSIIIASCAAPDTQHHIVISTREQKLALLDQGNLMAIYPVSTSKFGLGDGRGSCRTPLGELEVADKVGDGALPGLRRWLSLGAARRTQARKRKVPPQEERLPQCRTAQ